jgi:hypothetical protein
LWRSILQPNQQWIVAVNDVNGRGCIDAEDDDIDDDYVLSPHDPSLSQAASKPRDEDEDA